MLSRLPRSSVRRSAAGASAATAVSTSGRGSPRASHRPKREEEQRRDGEHVPLLDPEREARREDPDLDDDQDERRGRDGEERSLRRRSSPSLEARARTGR